MGKKQTIAGIPAEMAIGAVVVAIIILFATGLISMGAGYIATPTCPLGQSFFNIIPCVAYPVNPGQTVSFDVRIGDGNTSFIGDNICYPGPHHDKFYAGSTTRVLSSITVTGPNGWNYMSTTSKSVPCSGNVKIDTLTFTIPSTARNGDQFAMTNTLMCSNCNDSKVISKLTTYLTVVNTTCQMEGQIKCFNDGAAVTAICQNGNWKNFQTCPYGCSVSTNACKAAPIVATPTPAPTVVPMVCSNKQVCTNEEFLKYWTCTCTTCDTRGPACIACQLQMMTECKALGWYSNGANPQCPKCDVFGALNGNDGTGMSITQCKNAQNIVCGGPTPVPPSCNSNNCLPPMACQGGACVCNIGQCPAGSVTGNGCQCVPEPTPVPTARPTTTPLEQTPAPSPAQAVVTPAPSPAQCTGTDYYCQTAGACVAVTTQCSAVPPGQTPTPSPGLHIDIPGISGEVDNNTWLIIGAGAILCIGAYLYTKKGKKGFKF